MLSDRKRELEHRLSATLEENDLLQGTVEELQDRVLILERQGQDKDLQVQGPGPENRNTLLLSQKDRPEASAALRVRCVKPNPQSTWAVLRLAFQSTQRKCFGTQGYPSMCSEPLAPGAVSLSSFWSVDMTGAPGAIVNTVT